MIDPLEQVYGIDLSFDAQFGLQGTKDVRANIVNTDFVYLSGPTALAEELQRLFDLTPKGSCIDDPTYGIDLDFIGTALDPKVVTGLAKTACLEALQHPSFQSRFRVAGLEVTWNASTPDALTVLGVLELSGFEGVEYARFGPYALRYLFVKQYV